ncbi:hypothetical protein JST99_04315 [Candidatus Dependentiae bacterium]|nr:hypothetical protein [Candidatus Dependentiae bacterium]MCC7415418.1 hypothetical protein [Campylobacterota bacterium]
MHTQYRLSLILSLTFVSSWAGENNRPFLKKTYAFINSIAQRVPGTEAHNKAQRLTLARQIVQELDNHLGKNITNIVVESLGRGSTIINIPTLWKMYLKHNNSKPEPPIIEFATHEVVLRENDNRIRFITMFRDKNRLTPREFLCDGLNSGGFNVHTVAGHEQIPPFAAGLADSVRHNMFSACCWDIPQKSTINKDGQLMVVKPLDCIVGQGAHNFEVSLPEDTGRCLAATDPDRFKNYRTWFVLSALKQEEAKTD